MAKNTAAGDTRWTKWDASYFEKQKAVRIVIATRKREPAVSGPFTGNLQEASKWGIREEHSGVTGTS